MRFEKVVWTLLTFLVVAGSGLWGDPTVAGSNIEPRYESADGDIRIPPPLMDPGSTTTSAVQFTK